MARVSRCEMPEDAMPTEACRPGPCEVGVAAAFAGTGDRESV